MDGNEAVKSGSMTISEALEKLTNAIRLRHFSLPTEKSYAMWLRSYMEAVQGFPAEWSSERKVEGFLTNEARRGVAASTQTQAFNALTFFYQEVLKTPLGKIEAARARRPERVRMALGLEETRALLGAMEDYAGYATRLVTLLIYGCGLRVTEPLELRLKDVELNEGRLAIRGAKGGKDRVVDLPRSLREAMEGQVRLARVVWRGDSAAGLPAAMPGLLARKSPRLALTARWAWVFPAHSPMKHPRTGERVRWRMHEVNVQRAVRAAAVKAGIETTVTPHVLRHCYATHAHQAGAAARDLQAAMGHTHLDTTMRYLAPSTTGVRSPLDAMKV
jgi:integron integrase